jgi:hypothetical protein
VIARSVFQTHAQLAQHGVLVYVAARAAALDPTDRFPKKVTVALPVSSIFACVALPSPLKVREAAGNLR